MLINDILMELGSWYMYPVKQEIIMLMLILKNLHLE